MQYNSSRILVLNSDMNGFNLTIFHHSLFTHLAAKAGHLIAAEGSLHRDDAVAVNVN